MMNKTRPVTLYIIVALLLLNLFLILRFLIYKNRVEEEQKNDLLLLENYSIQVSAFEKYVANQIDLEKDLPLIISSLNLICKHSRGKIVLVFNENYCFSCIQKILQDFSLLSDRTTFKDFDILGAFDSKKEFLQMKQELNVNYSFNWIHSNNETIHSLSYPFVFLLDTNSEIKFVFSPEILPDLRTWYFYTLLEEYISKK